VLQASRVSPTLSGVFGMKWSVTQAASQPVASTWPQSCRTCSQAVPPSPVKIANFLLLSPP